MTYDIYAVYPEGSYKVVESNNAEHGMDVAERVCKSIGQWPHAIATLIRGEHVISGPVFNLEDLKKRK